MRLIQRSTRYVSGLLCLGAVAAVAIVVAASGASASAAAGAQVAKSKVKPTVVLVNGAWANSASWNGVITRLQAAGYTVIAPPNPLASLKGDAGYISDVLDSIKGPIVLVGHSYGGAVITNAAYGNHNVKALVYVDAFAPAQGESTLQLDSSRPGSALAAGPAKVFNEVGYPGAPKDDPELYVKTAVFEKSFANGLPANVAAVAAATQGPAVLSALTAPSGPPAWKTHPSWYLVGTIDKIIPTAEQLFMARRMHAHIVQVRAGHLSMVSDPTAVTNLVLAAARSTD
jgi:pimeloyl-ACP methyl ester carboxylesterase